ncbi:PAS domain-containing protein [Candidatus Fukatsuia symbiotica]|uniref:Uncharacterized protein n=1 Tax=Candidatus Fukatsuia symbiotica TaxID=1878942 RepID=A0A2U8I5N9_9GAMM|nr:PAS domain-containing protein [Candidatus Fukatsuia symbiotica]AWK14466.1 hypothetical protein CCS41_08235 [Candidatus Fukatsuia symbiotica]MEA9444749.1 PAS domain-containing protein [Candidatus Fukatsuia symbiotica]
MDNTDHEKSTDFKQLIVGSLESPALKSFMENKEEAWGIRDIKSRFVYMNRATLDFANLPPGFDFEGKLDSECPASFADFETELQEQDRKTEESRRSVSVIETHYFGRENKLQPYLCRKSPLYNEAKKCIGTVFQLKKYNSLSLPHYVNRLAPSVLLLDPPTEIFTERELEVVFFLQHPLQAKTIAQKFGFSQGEVEKHRENIYQKTNVYSSNQFKEFCKAAGLDRYIPPKLIQPNVKC